MGDVGVPEGPGERSAEMQPAAGKSVTPVIRSNDAIASGDATRLPGTSGIEAVYSLLSDRISDNFDLQWRGPTFALTAQSFLFIAFLSVMQDPGFQVLLAALIALTGVVPALVMLHVDRMIALDRHLLDEYEKILLADHPELRLHHTLMERDRVRAVRGKQSRQWPFADWLLQLNSVFLWVIMLLTFSGVGISLLIWAAMRS
jgi:hypothetical protein